MQAAASSRPTRRLLLSALPVVIAAPAAALAQGRAGMPSAQAVMAHPERYDPFSYVVVIQSLWSSGRRLQAAFWFYLFQVRSRPWANADTGGDGAAALRSALNDGLGQTINAWIGGDLAAWKMVAERAVTYERRLPLPAERPNGLSASAWQVIVDKARTDYATQMHAAFAGMTQETLAAQRRQNGLTAGVLENPGPPLPDAWR